MRIIDLEYYLEDELYQNLVVSKGCLDVCVEFSNGTMYKVAFYDRVRFIQTVDDELMRSDFFLEENVVLLDTVDRKSILRALEIIDSEGSYSRFISDQ